MEDLIFQTEDLINDMTNISIMARALYEVHGIGSTSEADEMLRSSTVPHICDILKVQDHIEGEEMNSSDK